MSFEAEAALFGWALDHNLNYVVRFHNAMRALLAEKASDPEFVDEPITKHTIELYQTMNSANALLLVLAFVEEMLLLFWGRHLPERTLPRKPSVARFKPLFQKLDLDLGTLPCWARLTDAFKIRHCILHANARVSTMRNPEEIRACIARYPDGLRERSDRVSVRAVFLQMCVTAARELQDELTRGEKLIDANRE